MRCCGSPGNAARFASFLVIATVLAPAPCAAQVRDPAAGLQATSGSEAAAEDLIVTIEAARRHFVGLGTEPGRELLRGLEEIFQ